MHIRMRRVHTLGMHADCTGIEERHSSTGRKSSNDACPLDAEIVRHGTQELCASLGIEAAVHAHELLDGNPTLDVALPRPRARYILQESEGIVYCGCA
jgi:hypothetical protein